MPNKYYIIIVLFRKTLEHLLGVMVKCVCQFHLVKENLESWCSTAGCVCECVRASVSEKISLCLSELSREDGWASSNPLKT